MCARVRACAGAAESLHTYIHIIIINLNLSMSESNPPLPDAAAPFAAQQRVGVMSRH